jgi:cell division control protein 42
MPHFFWCASALMWQPVAPMRRGNGAIVVVVVDIPVTRAWSIKLMANRCQSVSIRVSDARWQTTCTLPSAQKAANIDNRKKASCVMRHRSRTLNHRTRTEQTLSRMNGVSIHGHSALDNAFHDAESNSESRGDADAALPNDTFTRLPPSSTPTPSPAAELITLRMLDKLTSMPGKILALGDGAAGKTCFLIRATGEAFPQEYVPTVLDNYSAFMRCEKYNVVMTIGLWDTFARSDSERLRPLSYPDTDVMVLCFDVTSRVQFDNCFVKYLPEVKHHIPSATIVLLGLKSDLRSNTEVAKKLADIQQTMVSREEAEAAAAKFKMPYYEASALEDGAGVTATLQSFSSLVVERRFPALCAFEEEKPTSGGLFGLIKRLFSSTSKQEQQQQQQQDETAIAKTTI